MLGKGYSKAFSLTGWSHKLHGKVNENTLGISARRDFWHWGTRFAKQDENERDQ